jgi:hypothetical protein
LLQTTSRRRLACFCAAVRSSLYGASRSHTGAGWTLRSAEEARQFSHAAQIDAGRPWAEARPPNSQILRDEPGTGPESGAPGIRPHAMAEGEWPNLFLVGVLKGGTSSLAAYLDQHPDIFMSLVKEPHFFTGADPSQTRSVRDKRTYLKLFAGAQERVRGEASASYFTDSASPPAIKRASPEAKILVILRDPVERAYSHYLDMLRYGQESRSFAEAVEAELAGERPAGTEPYVSRGFYVEPLDRYLETFGENVHVLFLESMVRDPAPELREVFEFLQVDPDVADRLSVERRNTYAAARRPASRLVGSSRTRTAGRLLVPRKLRPAVERLLFKPAGKPAMDEGVRGVLQDIYGGDREPLEQRVGRPLPWD